MKRALVALLMCAAVASPQGYVWNPFTKKLDKVGAGAGGGGGDATIAGVQGDYTRCEDDGANDTYVCSMPTALTTYGLGGLTVNFSPGTNNTGPATLNIDGLGAIAIKQSNGSSDPADGALAADGWYLLTFDGTVFRMPQDVAGGGLTSFVGTGGAITGGTGTDPTVMLGFAVSAKTGNYTLVDGDRGTVVKFDCTDNCTATIPQAGSGGGFAAAWFVHIVNASTLRAIAVTPTTSTINGKASILHIGPNQGLIVFSDGTNYLATTGLEAWHDTGSTITAATYTVLAADRNGLKHFSNATGVAVTLPQAGTTSGLFPAGWYAWFENRGTGPVVITPTTSNIDAATSLTLQVDEGVMIVSNGTDYRTFRGMTKGNLVNAQTGTTYTLLTSDRGKVVFYNNVAAGTWTVPVIVSGNFPNGFRFTARVPATSGDLTINFGNNLEADTSQVVVSGTDMTFTSTGAAWRRTGVSASAPGLSTTVLTDLTATLAGDTISVSASAVGFSNYNCPGGIAAGSCTTTGGDGDLKVYVAKECQLSCIAPAAVTTSVAGSMVRVTASTGEYPDGAKPIGDYTVASGTPTLDSSDRFMFMNVPVIADTGLLQSVANGVKTLTTDPALVFHLGGTNAVTGSGDFGAATELVMPRGSGVPSSASCDALAEVGRLYINTDSGGLSYACKRTGASTYAWTAI